jgi:hypothetical protein
VDNFPHFADLLAASKKICRYYLSNSIFSLMTKAILLLPAAVLVYNFINKSHALGTVNFYPEGVKSLDFDNATPVMAVGLRVQNTTGQKFIIRSIAGNVYSNEYLVGNASNFVPFTVAANSQAILSINIRFALLGIVNDIIRAFQTKNFTQEIEFDGYANIDNFQIPIKIKYKVGL